MENSGGDIKMNDRGGRKEACAGSGIIQLMDARMNEWMDGAPPRNAVLMRRQFISSFSDCILLRMPSCLYIFA